MSEDITLREAGARRSALEPAGMASEDDGWQKRKSAQTRIAILQAAVECLASFGYARTTTQLIAQHANISRGAMMHHYATKQELIESVIDYTFYRRLENLTERIRTLSEHERIVEQAGIELFWQTLLTPEYQAYLELAVASRTDEELRTIFTPKARRFDAVWSDEIAAIFPEWADKRDKLRLAVDFCISAMEGLMLNRDIWEPRTRRQSVRRVVSLAILMIRDGDLGDAAMKG
ncbi:MAG: TetR family transcriptional regulator [Alphaproteobacteria bacterium]|nr:TetR family transcriptional regulator [Alphaproteobacteria bacterium]